MTSAKDILIAKDDKTLRDDINKMSTYEFLHQFRHEGRQKLKEIDIKIGFKKWIVMKIYHRALPFIITPWVVYMGFVLGKTLLDMPVPIYLVGITCSMSAWIGFLIIAKTVAIRYTRWRAKHEKLFFYE